MADISKELLDLLNAIPVEFVPNGDPDNHASQPAGRAYSYAQTPEGIDPRLKNLSYSSLLDLHSCPKLFQLNRLKARSDSSLTTMQVLTFQFGHTVGDGAQQLLGGQDIGRVLVQAFAGWAGDIFEVDTKRKKSLWHALSALSQLNSMIKDHGFLSDWEMLEYNSRPAMELSYAIGLPDGFRLRGFVDCVLKHKKTGEVRVIEIKTDSAKVLTPTKYKNSSQGVGYATILDRVAPGNSSYEVLYLVYGTSVGCWEQMIFPKTSLHRAIWLQSIAFDVEDIVRYEKAGSYPMRGESCLRFMQDCPHLHTCMLSAETSVPAYIPELHQDTTDYQIRLSFSDLVDQQIKENTVE